MSDAPTFAHLEAAAARIAPHVHTTPVLTCSTIDRMTGARVFFKCENLQKVGAFKFRGAVNAVLSLSDVEAASGVATHSSGNHGAALALAARLRGLEAFVVMPRNASAAKKRAVEGYGARIEPCGTANADRDRVLGEVVAATGATVIHPYDDPRIIAGQGTACMELIAEIPALDLIMTPVGGGGLLSGTAIAARALSASTRVIGAEPAGADDAWRSLQAGRGVVGAPPDTIADGLRAGIGTLTFAVIKALADDIVCVSEEDIVHAMRVLWERMKIIVEPSAAVPLAALLQQRVALAGERVGIILSGGNVDLDALPW